MMPFNIKPAVPINNRLLIALAGPQASGKTTSALRLASGIVSITGGKICLIDTENGRALRYAKNFKFNHLPFDPPFAPLRYLEAVEAAASAGYGDGDVLIIDSMSHEHEGPGGVLEMHEQFLQDKCGSDWGKREKLKFTAWIKPKADRTRAIQMGLQRNRAHIILCFRSKEKVAMVKDKGGKTEVVNAGWQPIGGDEYFYEMDITMILPEGAMGKPDWTQKASRINEYGEDHLRKLLHNTSQISEETGSSLAKLSLIQAVTPARTVQSNEPESIEQKTKRMAREIIDSFAKYTDKDELFVEIMEVRKQDLADIKSMSTSAYEYVMGEYSKRIDALEIAE
jgi:hypothetical protein